MKCRWTPGLAVLCLGLAATPGSAFPAPVARKATAAQAPAVLTPEALASRIDQHLAARLTERGVNPAALADDAEFMRRVYLDLTGRIPRVNDIRSFLADKSPDKRRKLVEDLLESPQYVNHFATTWTTTLLPQNNNQLQNFAFIFRPWVDKQIRDNVPYDRMVRELLTAPAGFGGGPGRPVQPLPAGISPIGFYQANENKPENLAASASRLFLGVRLECAQCHDHPFTSWTRKQFWEFAAFFAAVQPPQFRPGDGRQPLPAPDPNARTIKIPGTQKVVEARFLDGKVPQFQAGVNARAPLADWVTSPANPYFARTSSNRIWAHFFGIGLTDPIDDEPTEDNPTSHPELLNELATQFVANNFDMKYLIRAITSSQAYQRTSAVTDPAQAEPRLFARMALKGMTPEQLFDSLAEATGYQDNGPIVQGRVVLNQASPRGQFLAKFASQDKKTETQTSILQALTLMNGKLVSDATSLQRSTTLAALADAPFLSTARKVETLYLATLSRPPRPDELNRMVAYVERGGADGNANSALADVFWALLNSSEFIFNH